MPEPFNDPNILLNTIINSIKEIRDEQRDINIKLATLPTKEDLKENREFFLEQIDEVKEHLKDQDKQFSGVKIEVDKNSEFISNVRERFNWVVGAIFVAIISTVFSFFQSSLHQQWNQNNQYIQPNHAVKIHINNPDSNVK